MDQTNPLLGKSTADEVSTIVRMWQSLAVGLILKRTWVKLCYTSKDGVELFFYWIKQHLIVKSPWGNTENVLRIQIYVAIIIYCLVAIVKHDCKLQMSTFNVLRIFNHSLLEKTPIRNLFENQEKLNDRYVDDCKILKLDFEY